LKTSPTFWLTVEIQFLTLLLLVAVVIFFSLPPSEKKDFLELGLVLMCSFLTEVIGAVGFHFFHLNMNIVPNIYDIVAFPLIALLYRKHVAWKNKDLIISVTIILFVVFGLINFFFFQGIHGFDSYTSALSSMCIVVLTLSYFQVLVSQLSAESITKLPMFWIDTAMIFYYSAGFFLFLTADYLVKVLNNDLITFWMIHHCFRFVYLCMIIYALILIRSNHTKISH